MRKVRHTRMVSFVANPIFASSSCCCSCFDFSGSRSLPFTGCNFLSRY